jgi:LDH2 family malate/lactate/ureidoglycolate dehydrogenase
MADHAETLRIMPKAATRFASDLFAAKGVPPQDADIAARCLVRADLRGVDTHGIVRIPGYLDRIDKGLINPAPDLAFERVAPAAARLDGQNGLGFIIATRAVTEAIEIARDNGLGLVGIRNSTHYGMAATYLLQAVEAGFLAMVFTNASRAMPPWGGREELLGTSPFAVAAPNSKGVPFVLDMSPTVAARGKIRKALREGREIPDFWALDAQGRPTTDPEAALGGTLLPIAGPKGAGLSMMLDILCGVLTGANFAGEVGNQYQNYDRPQGVGHFILILRPDLFVAAEDFATRMQYLVGVIKANPKAEGFDEIYMPGEIEARKEAGYHGNGIPYRRRDLDPLLAIGAANNVTPPPSL